MSHEKTPFLLLRTVGPFGSRTNQLSFRFRTLGPARDITVSLSGQTSGQMQLHEVKPCTPRDRFTKTSPASRNSRPPLYFSQ